MTNLLRKFRNVVNNVKNAATGKEKPVFHRRYTKNSTDFHKIRVGGLEIINPKHEEPMTIECIDGRKEQYTRNVEDLPLMFPGEALAVGYDLRMFVPRNRQLLVFCGNDSKIYELVYHYHSEKKYIVNFDMNEIGSFKLHSLDGRFETPNGLVYESSQFSHAIEMDCELIRSDGKRGHVHATLPIYNGSQQRVAAMRTAYRKIIDVRRNSTYQECVDNKIPRPTVQAADGWLLRWNYFGNLGASKFKISKVENPKQARLPL